VGVIHSYESEVTNPRDRGLRCLHQM